MIHTMTQIRATVSDESAQMLKQLTDALDMPRGHLIETLIRSAFLETLDQPEAEVEDVSAEAATDPEPVYVAPMRTKITDQDERDWPYIWEHDDRIEARAKAVHAELHAAWRARQAEKNHARGA